jgi:hypothetical protein
LQAIKKLRDESTDGTGEQLRAPWRLLAESRSRQQALVPGGSQHRSKPAMAAEAEDPAQWLQANQARLPNVFRERLSFVAGLTSNFEAAGWLDPAQIASGGSRNEFPNTPPTQTALMCASSPPAAASACCMLRLSHSLLLRRCSGLD